MARCKNCGESNCLDCGKPVNNHSFRCVPCCEVYERGIAAQSIAIDEKLLDWYRSNDTGISSETIFEVMTGIPVKRHSVPWDSADFGRCYRLLLLMPEWRSRMHEVAEAHPSWAGLVDAWDRLDELYEMKSIGLPAALQRAYHPSPKLA